MKDLQSRLVELETLVCGMWTSTFA